MKVKLRLKNPFAAGKGPLAGNRMWFTNRVILGLLVFFVAVGVWEFHYKPQYRPYYEEGVKLYKSGDFRGALEQFQQAYVIAPNSSDVLLMMGWSNLKLHHFEEARFFFERTLKVDPRVTEARIGNSFVVLETGRGTLDVDAMTRVLADRPNDANVQIVAAGALLDQGENLKAEQMYRALLESANYKRAADSALRSLYGLDENEPIPAGLPTLTKPAGPVQFNYRAGDNALWRKSGGSWEKFYVQGVNFLPDTPGLTPGQLPNDPNFYSHWFQQVTELGANTIHVYSLMPPAFYRAYRRTMPGVGLLQEVALDWPSGGDLFDKPLEAAKAEIRYAIDAIHGNGDVPRRGRRASGIYVTDVSANVVGILLGGDLDPAAAVTTNLRNPEKTGYTGRFVSVSGVTPVEVWVAQMLDYAAQYETDTYGVQHPLAFANQPAFDPLTHPTESTATRNDVVSIDESKFRTGPGFAAGLFASYSVRPYYPDFLLREQRILAATDAQGPNPVAGYVRDLRARVRLPLVISDFGIPSAIGIAHQQRAGWSEGGISESEQASFDARMAGAIRDAGCAGAVVYQLTDEWYRSHGIAAQLESPRDRAALWLNEMSPDSRFGLIGFHSSGWQLFQGDGSAWKNERTLYQNPASAGPEPGRNLRSVQAASDEAFLYVRLNLSCVECKGKSTGKGNLTDFPAFAIALNTLPGRAGVQKLPFGNVRLSPGANFLVYLGPDAGKLLVATNYDPFQIVSAPGSPNNNDFRWKKAFMPSLQSDGNFEDLVLQVAEPVYGRDGVYYPAQRYNASLLRRAQENIGKPEMDSIAEWYVDPIHNAIVVRIAWGKLLVSDPSSTQVVAGVDGAQNIRTETTSGVNITVFSLQGGTAQDPRTWSVATSLPAPSGGAITSPAVLNWKVWNSVSPEAYRKPAFLAMQKEFGVTPHVAAPAALKVPAEKKTGKR